MGVVEDRKRIGKPRVQKGDVLIGLQSNGFHTNGYSLVRKIVFEKMKLKFNDRYPNSNETVADVLLRVHRSYLAPLEPLIAAEQIHALAHITGGGIPENLDRVIPEGLSAHVQRRSWEVPADFAELVNAGQVPLDDAERTFNMGIGMIAVVGTSDADAVANALREAGEGVSIIGSVEAGDEPVVMV